MANLLSFVVVAGAIVGGPLIWLLSRSRSQPGTRQMVLLGGAAGEAELSVWVAALRSAGISARVRNVGDFPSYGNTPHSYEIWVPAGDEARDARCWACRRTNRSAG